MKNGIFCKLDDTKQDEFQRKINAQNEKIKALEKEKENLVKEYLSVHREIDGWMAKAERANDSIREDSYNQIGDAKKRENTNLWGKIEGLKNKIAKERQEKNNLTAQLKQLKQKDKEESKSIKPVLTKCEYRVRNNSM